MPFKVHKIAYEATNSFSKTVVDYINEAKTIQPFYKYKVDIDSFAEAIKDKAKDGVNRTILVDELNNQYANLEVSYLTQQNIEALKKDNTFTVCTAHQLNLFTGPLYVIFKIVAAINLAESLNQKYTDNHFVPIYWMGGEDHDFEEINHCNLFNKTVTWQSDETGATGRFSLKGIEVALNEIENILGESDIAKDLIKDLKTHFTDNETYGEACFSYINSLFANKGLLIINADKPSFKNQFKNVIVDELKNATAEKTLSDNIEAFDKHYKVQAKPRNINLFYLANQQRGLIEKNENGFSIKDSELQFTNDELIDLAENEPEKFSPNVILRPLYQETILPNLAYIGGGGELAYWLELQPLFENYKVNFPMLILRNSAAFIDKKSMLKWRNLALNEADLFKEEHILSEQFVKQSDDNDIDFKEEIDSLNKIKDQLLSKANDLDQSLKQPVEGEFTKIEKGLDNLQQKFLRAAKRKNESTLNVIPTVQNKLKPNGHLQERYLNYLQFKMKYGEAFFDLLYENLNPLNKHFLLFEELEN